MSDRAFEPDSDDDDDDDSDSDADDDDDDSSSSSDDDNSIDSDVDESGSGSDDDQEVDEDGDDPGSGAKLSYLAEFDLSGIDLAPFASEPKSPSRPTKRDKVPRTLTGDVSQDAEDQQQLLGDADDDLSDLLSGDSIERALAGVRTIFGVLLRS
jgi:hypothetical protein